MDLTEALLHRYTNSVVSILNAVRDPHWPRVSVDPRCRSLVRGDESVTIFAVSVDDATATAPRAWATDARPEHRAHRLRARTSPLAPRFDFRGGSPRTHPRLVPNVCAWM